MRGKQQPLRAGPPADPRWGSELWICTFYRGGNWGSVQDGGGGGAEASVPRLCFASLCKPHRCLTHFYSNCLSPPTHPQHHHQGKLRAGQGFYLLSSLLLGLQQ